MLVRAKSLRLSSSEGLEWNNIAVERILAEPGERDETVVDGIFIKLACGKQVTHGERLNRYGRSEQYVKEPGTIIVYSEGILPVVRPSITTELIVCALNRTLVKEVGEELGWNHGGIQTIKTGFRDAAVGSLIELLEQESKFGGNSGQLYVDHLTYALTVRLLCLGARRGTHQNSPAALPGPRLRRVIERMQAGLSSDVDLKTLAMESGYSRNHFLKMFREATGYTPYQYLLRLRVLRAQELMKNRSMPLIDIALECGFASHSHLSHAFRRIVGARPSEYRREV